MTKSSLVPGLALVAVLAVAGCQANASSSAGASASASPAVAATTASEADRTFIDGMVPHHEMALMMADDALANATHAELKTYAQQVKDGQGQEIAQMKAWRKAWFGSDATHSMDPGMQMGVSAGAGYDGRWAAAMSKHHQGANDMAQAALDAATRPEVKTLARKIIDAQKSEQTQLDAWSKLWTQ